MPALRPSLRRAALACCLVACAAFCGPAARATEKLEPPDLEEFLRWGPLRVRPGFELSNIGYDDNILYNESDKVSDYTATLSPKVRGLLRLGDRAFLTLDQRFDYAVYVQNSDQNYLDSRTTARLTLPLRRFGLFVDGDLARQNFRPVDREDLRPEREARVYGLGAILYPGWRTEIEIGRRDSRLRYTDPDDTGSLAGGTTIGERLDRDERGTTLEAAYKLFGRTSVVFGGLRKSIEFSSPFGTVPRDTDEWRALTGLRFGEGGRLTGEIRLGRGEIDAEDPSLPDFSDFVGEMELAWLLGWRTRLRLEGERLPGFAVYEGNAYFLDTHVGLRALHYLTRVLGLEAGITAGRLRFPASSGGFEREDETRSYNVGVRVRLAENAIGQRIDYTVSIGRYRRDSNESFADQSRTTFSIGGVIGF